MEPVRGHVRAVSGWFEWFRAFGPASPPRGRTTSHPESPVLDVVHVLGLIAVFALLGAVAWGVGKL